jgi:hypothetical protein
LTKIRHRIRKRAQDFIMVTKLRLELTRHRSVGPRRIFVTAFVRPRRRPRLSRGCTATSHSSPNTCGRASTARSSRARASAPRRRRAR